MSHFVRHDKRRFPARPLGQPEGRGLLSVMSAFALAAGVNTASVLLEQRWQALSRLFQQRAWEAHLALIAPPWTLFLVQLSRLDDRSLWRLPRKAVANPNSLSLGERAGEREQVRPLRWLGIVASLMAVALWSQAVAAIGPARFANAACFGRAATNRIRGGSFRFLRNPIYDSYALALLGTALRKSDARYLVLALESFILLNLIEAPVEDRCLGRPIE